MIGAYGSGIELSSGIDSLSFLLIEEATSKMVLVQPALTANAGKTLSDLTDGILVGSGVTEHKRSLVRGISSEVELSSAVDRAVLTVSSGGTDTLHITSKPVETKTGLSLGAVTDALAIQSCDLSSMKRDYEVISEAATLSFDAKDVVTDFVGLADAQMAVTFYAPPISSLIAIEGDSTMLLRSADADTNLIDVLSPTSSPLFPTFSILGESLVMRERAQSEMAIDSYVKNTSIYISGQLTSGLAIDSAGLKANAAVAAYADTAALVLLSPAVVALQTDYEAGDSDMFVGADADVVTYSASGLAASPIVIVSSAREISKVPRKLRDFDGQTLGDYAGLTLEEVAYIITE